MVKTQVYAKYDYIIHDLLNKGLTILAGQVMHTPILQS